MQYKISLFSAIVINLNVMIGAGIFINTVLLSQNAGALGAAVYAVVGCIMLPLLLSIARLNTYHKGGNFYDYGAHMGPYAGFLTLLSYFIANQISSALAVHVCISLLQTIFPTLAVYSAIMLDCFIITIFALLNSWNLTIGKKVQWSFMIAKLIPIVFVILLGLYFFNIGNFSIAAFRPMGIIATAPFVLYAFMGFEATCSLSRLLKDPERDGPRAMLIAYFLGIAIVCLFQTALYGAIGLAFDRFSTYLETIPALLTYIPFIGAHMQFGLKALLHCGIAASALGSAYGVMYFNLWNLYELAEKNSIPGSVYLRQLNACDVPVVAVFVAAGISMVALLATCGDQVPLQQIAAFGMTFAYFMCSLGLVFLVRRQKGSLYIPLLGVASCCLLLFSACKNFMVYGSLMPGIVFLMLLLLGSISYGMRGKKVV